MFSLMMTVDASALHGTDAASRAIAGSLPPNASIIARVEKVEASMRSALLPGLPMRLPLASVRPALRALSIGGVALSSIFLSPFDFKCGLDPGPNSPCDWNCVRSRAARTNLSRPCIEGASGYRPMPYWSTLCTSRIIWALQSQIDCTIDRRRSTLRCRRISKGK